MEAHLDKPHLLPFSHFSIPLPNDIAVLGWGVQQSQCYGGISF